MLTKTLDAVVGPVKRSLRIGTLILAGEDRFASPGCSRVNA
jgi:hypothetical protein